MSNTEPISPEFDVFQNLSNPELMQSVELLADDFLRTQQVRELTSTLQETVLSSRATNSLQTPDYESLPDGPFGEIIKPFLANPQAMTAFIELGNSYRASNANELYIASHDNKTKAILTAAERRYDFSLKRAYGFADEMPDLDYQQVFDSFKDINDEKQQFGEYMLEKSQNGLTDSDMFDIIDQFKSISGKLLTPQERDLLIGVGIVQFSKLFEDPEVQSKVREINPLSSNSPFRMASISLGQQIDPDEPNETKFEDIDHVARETAKTKLFGKAKQERARISEFRRKLMLPQFIKNMHVHHENSDTIGLDIMQNKIDIAYEMEAVHVLRSLDSVVNQVGEFVETTQSEEAMLDALVIDGLKHQILSNLQTTLLHMEPRSLEGRRYIGETTQRLGSFSLESALNELENEAEKQEMKIQHDELVKQLDAITGRYDLSNKQLRDRDPKLEFLGKLRHIDLGDKKLDPKDVIKFLFALAEIRNGGDDPRSSFDQLIDDIAFEQDAVGRINELPMSIRRSGSLQAIIGPKADWVFKNAEQLLNNNGLLPKSLRRLLEELVVYKRELAGEALASLLPEETPFEDLEEPVHSEEELLEDESSPLDDILDVEFTEIAEQLDWIVFPPGTSMHQIRQQIGGQIDSSKVNWDRIQHLVDLVDKFGGQIYRSRDKDMLGTSIPYLVAEFDLNDKRFAVAECPEIGNATYVVCEDKSPGTWQEVMALSRASAIQLGAKRIIHPQEEGHLVKIVNTLNNMLVVKAK